MPNIIVDLVEDSGLERRYSGAAVMETATRVAQVTGLDDGSSTAAATAMQRALDAVATQYPKYLKYSSTSNAVIMGHQVVGIFDDVVKVRILYSTPVSTAEGSSQTFVIEDDTITVSDTTQIVLDDQGALQQIIIQFKDPKNPKIKSAPMVGTVSYERTLRRIVLSGVLKAQFLDPYRAAVNCVNDAEFLGLPRAYWRFANWSSQTLDLGRTYMVRAELLADIERDWSKYVVGRNANNGKLIAVAKQDLNALQNRTYVRGILTIPNNPGAGIVRVCPYNTTDYSALFNV